MLILFSPKNVFRTISELNLILSGKSLEESNSFDISPKLTASYFLMYIDFPMLIRYELVLDHFLEVRKSNLTLQCYKTIFSFLI